MRMGSQRIFLSRGGLLALLLLPISSIGCGLDNAWTASQDESYRDDIQATVIGKLDDQSARRSGLEWWELYRADTYQLTDKISQDPKRSGGPDPAAPQG